ncbi:winged helix-turn-helix transcriptional regulator [Chryseobacterium sp.]
MLPPAVEYSLTPKEKILKPVILEIQAWAIKINLKILSWNGSPL